MVDSRSEVSREGYQRCQHGTEVLFELLAALIRPGMGLLWHFDGTGFSSIGIVWAGVCGRVGWRIAGRKGYQRCQHGIEVLFELLAVLIRPGMGLLWHYDGTGFSTTS
jgi:hypothetical protein